MVTMLSPDLLVNMSICHPPGFALWDMICVLVKPTQLLATC